MCGILGVISSRQTASRVNRQILIAMRDTMAARGPDDRGLFQHENIQLAHRRLAIRDLTAGHQPWLSADRRFALVYNGEIYNDDQLRRELTARGHTFRTRCDTEVLMQAWLEWGSACVQRLRGMFAFGVVDLVENRWWLVRDRCGVKPLYYAQVGRDFVFASSVAAIAKHPDFSPRPDFTVLRHYLATLRLTFDNRTVFSGVHTMRPGEIIGGSGDDWTETIYWSPDQPIVDSISFQDSVEELETRLQESVAMRLKSDVPVGMMLSGGVDSNMLASLTHPLNQKPMVGRCGGGVDPQADSPDSDFLHAADFAKRLGFEYASVRVSEASYRRNWDQLIDNYATPISTPTDVIIYEVAADLRKYVGVALGGEGADEAFCGYTIPHWSGNDFDRASHMGRLPSAEAELAKASLQRQYGRDRFYSPSDHYLTTNGLIPRQTQMALFKASHWGAADAQRTVEKYYDRLFEIQGDRPMVEKYARVLFRLNLESLLGRLDSATMAASLEARVPFTDHPVVEQAFRIPHRFKIDIDPQERQPWLSSLELAQRGSLRGKRILRSVAKRWMPEKMAQRPKMSFPTPLAKWLHSDWKSWVNRRLNSSRFANEIFRSEALDEMKALPAGLSMWNWPILNIAIWGDRWF
jgi:asparagine synthase (glutamine-hydrolysing)